MKSQRYSPQDIERAKAQKSLAAEIGKRVVPLRKSGRNYVGCCPFHQEKTPSFNVVEDKGFAHCFGCGWNGDIIKWLEDAEGYSFADAIDYLMGGAARPSHEATPPVQMMRAQTNAPEYVDSRVVADYIRPLAVPIGGTLVETYLTSAKRGINLDAIRSYTDVLGFVAQCPMSAWHVGGSPRDVRTAPAMVAPFHHVERRMSLIYGEPMLFIEFRGMHVTYLEADGSDKLQAFKKEGTPIINRKMFGQPNGCAILFTSMEPTRMSGPLLEGEGIETTLSALSIALRSTPIMRAAATMSLGNHQGYAMTDRDGALPMYDVRYDAKRSTFGFTAPGEVISAVDADMKDHMIKVRRKRGGPISNGIASAERTKVCEMLLRQKWTLNGARNHVTLVPPPGMDYNDLVKIVANMQAGDEGDD